MERRYIISTAKNKFAKRWAEKRVTWELFAKKCSETRRTGETQDEYFNMPKTEQDSIKDVGGFVGGSLKDGVRRKSNVVIRSMATLDIDHGDADTWGVVLRAMKKMRLDNTAFLMYSTHKHKEGAERYRLVIPFNRDVLPDEYTPLTRMIASIIDMSIFDDSTYETARLFYWPSTSKDAPFFFKEHEGEPLNVDDILTLYNDYHDASEWPKSIREIEKGTDLVGFKELKTDPRDKPGVIGAFCRAYSIEDAIDKFLPDVYAPTSTEGRYTFAGGTTTGGLRCYNGTWAYSSHESDPANNGHCLSAFDLVRVHKFPGNGKKSRDDMYAFAMADTAVKAEVRRAKLETARADMAGMADDDDEPEGEKGKNDSWELQLDTTRSGERKPTLFNIFLILENDPRIAGKLYYDEMARRKVIKGELPWNSDGYWTDNDDAELRMFLAIEYGMTCKKVTTEDAIRITYNRHRRHPVREYLDSLIWDGTPRLETLFIDYLMAEDNVLNRAAAKKAFTAAVTRIYKPGTKFDHCTVLAGTQGIGKSMLIRIMGGEWTNDSPIDMNNKDGMDALGGTWLVELAELTSIKRAELETVKSFLSKTEDKYRAAYERNTCTVPRQCVFFATTNETYFLKGDTGNRRFWIVPVKGRGKPMQWLIDNRDQLWAEAVHYYHEGADIMLTEEEDGLMTRLQDEYNESEDDPAKEMLAEFLKRPILNCWDRMSIKERQAYYSKANSTNLSGKAIVGDFETEVVYEERLTMRPVEFLCEFMGRSKNDPTLKYDARRVCSWMKDMEGWYKAGRQWDKAGLYGNGVMFKRN